MMSSKCLIKQLINEILDEKIHDCEEKWYNWCEDTNYTGEWNTFFNELEQIKEKGIDGIINQYPNIENYNKLEKVNIYEYEWNGDSDADGNPSNPEYKNLKNDITKWLDSFFQNLLEIQKNI